jgi:CheY-like chemotaxis protein
MWFECKSKNKRMKNVQNLKFFIVDDDPFCRMLYQQHLNNLGYKNNVLFENGPDCIEQLGKQPDVIFIDYDMLPINGIETLKLIKKCNPNIHLLIISAQKDKQVEIDALELGAFDYIVKGEKDLDRISHVINNILVDRAQA